MARDNIIVGMEIGTSKVCVVVAEAADDGGILISGVGQAQSCGVRKGEVVDFDTAQVCVREALANAEENSSIDIGSAYIAISGAHIASLNCRGQFTIPEDQEEITEEDCDRVSQSARAVGMPPERTTLHAILQHYFIDGQEGVINPVGMAGSRLEADFHLIHGIHNRIKNTIRCVKDIGVVEVADVVFSGLAAAQAVLTPHDKELGALVIDIGGGTTDYLAYLNGAVRATGVLGVGGDHVTNDISLGLRIPMARAEKLKCEEGSAVTGRHHFGETVVLKDDAGFAGREIDREKLDTIIHMRMKETLELLRRRLESENVLDFLGAGVFITGGCARMKGLKPLVEDVFGLPARVATATNVGGMKSVVENPQFSTAIGMVIYANALQAERVPTGLFGKIKGLFGKMRLF
jgi:cell division protein FtsA